MAVSEKKRERAKDVSLAESEAELESGDLFADDLGDDADESVIANAVAAVDDMVFEEDPSEETVSETSELSEEDQIEAEPANLVPVPATVSSNAVDPGVTNATERITETQRADPPPSAAIEASPDDGAPAPASTQPHLQIPDEFIAMDPEEAHEISRRVAPARAEPASNVSIVEQTAGCEVDDGGGPQTERIESPSVETSPNAGRSRSRVGLVQIVGAVLVVAAVLVYMFVIRRPADSRSTPAEPVPASPRAVLHDSRLEQAPGSDGLQAESARTLPRERPEPESGPIVFGRKTEPQPDAETRSADPEVPPARPSPAAAESTTPPARTPKPRTTPPAGEVEAEDASPKEPATPIELPAAPAAASEPQVKDVRDALEPAGAAGPEMKTPDASPADSVGPEQAASRPSGAILPAPVETDAVVAAPPEAGPRPEQAAVKQEEPKRPALLPAVASQGEVPGPEVVPRNPDSEPEPEPELSAASTGSAPYDEAPQLIENSRVDPAYPAIAQRLRKRGSVLIRATIAADGSVKEVEVVSDSAPRMGFGDAAMKAVRRWNYEPARLDGKPVEASISVHISFSP